MPSGNGGRRGGLQEGPGELLGSNGEGFNPTIPIDPTDNIHEPEIHSEDCPYGWVSALTTPDGSCGHVKINPNAIIDPLAWDHIVVPIAGGLFLIATGAMMIQVGVKVCTSVVGCIAGAPVILAGVAAIPAGAVFIYTGIKTTEHYLHEVFEVVP
jgi:hypothetical protein